MKATQTTRVRRAVIGFAALAIIATGCPPGQNVVNLPDLDQGFGTAGGVSVTLPKVGAAVTQILKGASGSTLVVESGPAPSGGVTRLLTNGTVDTAYSANANLTSFCSQTVCTYVADRLGRLYARNYSGSIRRFTATGSVDTTYGTNGTISNAPTTNTASAALANGTLVLNAYPVQLLAPNGTTSVLTQGYGSVAVDSADRVYVLITGGVSSVYTLRRYIGTTLDTSFGSAGAVTVPSLAYGAFVDVDASDRPVVISYTGVRRYTTTGATDGTFGAAGLVSALPFAFNRAETAIVGNTVMSVNFNSTQLATLSATGAITMNQLVLSPLAASTTAAFGLRYSTMIAGTNGTTFVVAGLTTVPDPVLDSVSATALVSVLPSMSANTAWSSNGLVTMRHATLNLRPAGIFPAGTDQIATFTAFDGGAVAVKTTATGALDTSFSGDGILAMPNAASIAVDHLGRVITTNGAPLTMSFNTSPTTAVTRFTTAGTLDPSFDGDGTVDLQGLCSGHLITVLSDNSAILSSSSWCPVIKIDSSGGQSALPALGTGPTSVFTATGDPAGRYVYTTGQTMSFAQPSVIRRTLASGAADTTFGASGSIPTPNYLSTIATLGDSSVVTGSSGTGLWGTLPGMTVRRTLENGTQIVSSGDFSATGELSISGVDAMTTSAQRILMSGWGPKGFVRIYLPDGTRDTTLPGGDGLLEFGESSSSQATAAGVAGGRLFASTANNGGVTIYRFNGSIS